ncbi:MAG: YgfZ/GcvT domain-containing protein [Ilumatobacteraceae bacterium]
MRHTADVFRVRIERDGIAVTGADAARYLQSQLSQEIASMGVGSSAWSFVLSPTGKVDSLVRVQRTAEDSFILDTDAGFGDGLMSRLLRFRIRVAVEMAPVERPIAAFRGAGLPPMPEGALVAWGDGFDLDAGHTAMAAAGFDAVPAGTDDDLTRARIDACWPAMGAEIVPGETVPAETGVVSLAVSFTKGCYPGQELVERMDSRGAAAPWRLEAVDVGAGAAQGDALERDGAVIGTLTSVLGTRAIARIRRSA